MSDELGLWLRGPGPLFLRARDALRGGELPATGAPAGEGLSLFDAEFSAIEAGREPCEADLAVAGEELRSFSAELYDRCLLAWMSSESLENYLLAVAREAGSLGSAIISDYSRETSRLLGKGCARVEREIHRLIGLARFSPRRDGIYSAALGPDHLIFPAMAPHFMRRFSSDRFVLVDCRRGLALLWSGLDLSWWRGSEALAFLPDTRESDAELLWRGYFAATENLQRHNPELQRRLMPERYWKYLTELTDRDTSR